MNFTLLPEFRPIELFLRSTNPGLPQRSLN
jgi:hypothetical protein